MPVSAKRVTEKKSLERRGAIRARRKLAIQHRLIKSQSKHLSTEWLLSTTRDMSVTGILFSSNVPYKPGAVIEIEVTMSGVIEIFKSFAKVVRVVKTGPTAFDVAVKLVELKPRSRSAKSHFKP
jgi:hypothetical protein